MDTRELPIVAYRDHWTPDHVALLCGIANAGGGTLVIESSDKVYNAGRRKMRRPFEQIPKLVEKELGLRCTTEPVLDGTVLCLEIAVPPAPKPLSYEGTYWLFVDDTNTRSTRKVVQMVMDGGSPTGHDAPESWEMQPQPSVDKMNLNTQEFLALATLKTDVPDLPTDSLGVTLDRRLGYLQLVDPQTHGITNAGVLLLHNEPDSLIPGAFAQLRLIAQDGRVVLENEVRGTLPHQQDEALRLLFEQYMPMAVATASSMDDAAIALNLPPREAIRDALLGALVRKDYALGTPLRVDVTASEVVIGGAEEGDPSASGADAPFAQDDEEGEHRHPERSGGAGDARHPERSGGAAESKDPTNPVLARALQLLGIMDSRGVDFDRIAKRCTAIGLEAPVLGRSADGLSITFPLDSGNGGQMKPPPPEA